MTNRGDALVGEDGAGDRAGAQVAEELLHVREGGDERGAVRLVQRAVVGEEVLEEQGIQSGDVRRGGVQLGYGLGKGEPGGDGGGDGGVRGRGSGGEEVGECEGEGVRDGGVGVEEGAVEIEDDCFW